MTSSPNKDLSSLRFRAVNWFRRQISRLQTDRPYVSKNSAEQLLAGISANHPEQAQRYRRAYQGANNEK